MSRRNPTLRAALSIGTMLIAAGVVFSQVFSYPKATDPRKFALMAWGDSPSDAEQLAHMKEAGLNISGFCKVDDLEKVAKAGLACFVDDPRARGYDWTKLPPREQIQENAKELRAAIHGSPAALGWVLSDEPNAGMISGLGQVAGILKREMPELWPYVNGFPINAGRARIGAIHYEDYLRAEVRQIGQPFLSYDQYDLHDGAIGDAFFANLEVARRIGIETHVPFWNVVLSTTLPGLMAPSEPVLRAQAYGTLVYGGRGIAYFTYFRPDATNFDQTPVDGFGNRTPAWDILHRLNGEILTLEPILETLHSTGVYHYPTPFEPEQTDSLIVDSVELHAPGRAQPEVVIGEFADDQGHSYLLAMNKNLGSAVRVKIKLVEDGRKLERISPYSGRKVGIDAVNGEPLEPGAGMLLAIE